MLTVPYSCHVRSVPDGRLIYPYCDSELQVVVYGDTGRICHPEIVVVNVNVVEDGKWHDLLFADDLLAVGTGLRIKAAAEADKALRARVLHKDGWEFVGHHGDPESGWRRVRRVAA